MKNLFGTVLLALALICLHTTLHQNVLATDLSGEAVPINSQIKDPLTIKPFPASTSEEDQSFLAGHGNDSPRFAGNLYAENSGWGSLTSETSGGTVKIPDRPKRGRRIAIMPPIDPKQPEDPADTHLRAYLGQMKDIDQIYEAATVDEFYEILAKMAESGEPIERLIILGHGRESEPGIKLGDQNRLEMADLDLKILQKDLMSMVKEYEKSRATYCQEIEAGKKPALKTAYNVRNLPAKITRTAEKVRQRQKQMERVSEAMSDYGQIMLLNCYGAATDKHEAFLKQLGRVLMWKRTGGSITASKRRIDVNLVAGGKTGYGLPDHLIGSGRIIQAFVKTGKIVKPGDYYASGAGVDYFNWKNFPIAAGAESPFDEKLIQPGLLAQAERYKGAQMPECNKKAKPSAPPVVNQGTQGSGGTVGGTYPGSPFNGMQIDYSFSGGAAGAPKDKPGFTTSRGYTGTLGSGTMNLSGKARMGNGYGADVVVKIWAGKEQKSFKAYIKSGHPGFNEETFNLNIPIPAEAASGGFQINMTGHYNVGTRGLIVGGQFSR